MRGLNLKEIMSKSNMNQQGLNIATYGQAYSSSLNKGTQQMFLVKYLFGEANIAQDFL